MGTDHVQPLSQFMRVKLGAYFGPGPFTLDTVTIMIRGLLLRLMFLKELVGVNEMFLWTKSMNESSPTFQQLMDAL